jgi:hypothetical protein
MAHHLLSPEHPSSVTPSKVEGPIPDSKRPVDKKAMCKKCTLLSDWW